MNSRLPSVDNPPSVLSGGLCVAVDREALRHNCAQFRSVVPPSSRLLAVVKADGYGHGLLLASESFLAGGADVLGVHSVAEAEGLRAGGIQADVLILGPLGENECLAAARCGAEITVASLPACRAAGAAAGRIAGSAASATGPTGPTGAANSDGGPASDASLRLHLKFETGVNRQGILLEELDEALQILSAAPGLELVGVSSHFADIEDTTDHGFARGQMERFDRCLTALAERGHDDLCRHMSCSASAILWNRPDRDLVRVGISAYGIWPSRETLVSANAADRARLDLRPAVTWSCPVAQVKTVPVGETVGYGRSWRALVDSRIAVLPVGYADGYPRSLSDRAQVLIRGQRAPLCGRICMNLCMVDVTHIAEVAAGDQAVLLGHQGCEDITAEELAGFAGTIAYEVLTWPTASWQRMALDRETTEPPKRS